LNIRKDGWVGVNLRQHRLSFPDNACRGGSACDGGQSQLSAKSYPRNQKIQRHRDDLAA
jgi:hypothetical protein